MAHTVVPAPWTLTRGAMPLSDRGVRFSVWAPRARRVAVHLVGESRAVHPLDPGDDGVFELVVPEAEAGADYFYRLDDGADRPDPASRFQPGGVHGPSRVVDPTLYQWHDDHWAGREMADLAIYELHVGTFTEDGTFDDVVSRLEYLRALGVTAIELMPVAEFPGARNWGYDGVCLYAPGSAYGGPEGLRRLVDAAHQRDLAVVLDVVYNHVGPEGNYLAEFGPYFTDRYRTPWGPAINYDDGGSDEVRRFIVDNACYWIAEYHVDALRLDAVHSIFDFSARHILEELGDAVHELGSALGRRTLVIAESDLNDPRVVRPPERGGYGLDAQWSDDFHHAVHAALTGETDGYYADFGGIDAIASALEERFVYAGRRSVYRGRRHGAPALDVSADRFVVCVQNHDQVGNRARGDRLSTLLSLNGCKLAAALLLLSPYVPLIFMGEEYAETNPFAYFVSHGDPDLLAAVREGRRSEFASFGWAPDEIPDPGAEATFAASKLDWRRLTLPGHEGMLALYADLLQLRRDEPSLRAGRAEVRAQFDPPGGWLSLRLASENGRAILGLFNFNATQGEVRIPLVEPGAWELVLTTDDERYAGEGRGQSDGSVLNLPGRGAGVFASGER